MFKKLIVKCDNDNTYLSPFLYGKHWENDINKAFVFNIKEDISDILDICVDVYLDKENINVYELNDKKELIPYVLVKKNKNDYIFEYSEFKAIKKNFNETKDKDTIHYLIYAIIKNKDIFKTLIFGRKKFKLTFSKLVKFIKIVKNYDVNKFYLKKCFENIEEEKFKEIIKKLEQELQK